MVNERSNQRVRELRNYQWLNRKVTSEYLEMGFVVDSILFDMQLRDIPIPPQQKYLDNLKDHVKVIISNLYDTYNSDGEQYVGYLRRSGGYKRKRGIKGFQFGYQNVRKVTDYLRDYGYIEQVDGYKDLKTGKPHLSKMRATDKLIDLLEKHKQVTPDMIKIDTSNEEVIILKGLKPRKRWRVVFEDGKKKKKRYQPPRKICKTPDTGKVRKMRDNLKLINSIMEKADIKLDITDEELRELNHRLNQSRNQYKRAVDFSRKTLHRTFLDRRLDRGGRLYGPWYQNIYKEYRSKIMINDLVTLEFDFSGYHINILYALEELPLPEEDPYKLDGFSDAKETREFFKRVLLVVLNTKRETKSKAKDAVIRRIIRDVRFGELIQPEEIQDINAAIDQFAIKHEPIQQYFFTGYGIYLQYIDSQIAEKILLYFATTLGVPCLPVHDSFIIHAGLVFKLQEIMLHYFEQEFTQKIPITYDMDEVLFRQGMKYRERYQEEKKFMEGLENK